jgi:hypothetical protein
MTIPYRQQWVLRRIGRRLRRSDPHMAAMLAIFARLYVGEVILSAEQTGRHPVRRALAWLTSTAAAGARWVFRRVASACAAVRWRLGRTTPSAPAADQPLG